MQSEPNLQVFVANPKKSPKIKLILYKNKSKLCTFLKSFQQEREEEDSQFAEEKMLLIEYVSKINISIIWLSACIFVCIYIFYSTLSNLEKPTNEEIEAYNLLNPAQPQSSSEKSKSSTVSASSTSDSGESSSHLKLDEQQKISGESYSSNSADRGGESSRASDIETFLER
jgi:hypothetical protein